MYYHDQASHMSATRKNKTTRSSLKDIQKADEANGSDWSVLTSDKGQRELTGSCANVKRNDTGSTDFYRQLALQT
jgi:hypothetical protein